MSRTQSIFVGVFAMGCLGLLAYACATRIQPAGHDSNSARPTAARAETAASERSSAAQAAQPARRSDAQRAEDSSQTIAAETLAKWAIETTDSDSKTRAVAIVALASAPKAQAVPILQRVLRTGEPQDRQLALGSLRTLALDQGDADGVIRDVLRQVSYHGDDDDVIRGAQAALDDIDRESAESAD